jgi:MFS family permease
MSSSSAKEQAWPPAGTGWYATVILTLAYTFSFIDRQVLNLLVEPVKADLALSDTRISFLQGAAFVGTYVLMSVPIGRLVDRFKRVYVLIGGVLTWSIATVGCGLSGSFGQLLSARMFVGAGESSVTPAAWSLLADYFPRDRLARPVSVFLIGPYLGAGLALIIGAEVIDWAAGREALSMPFFGELAPWQFTFIVVGLPGFLLSALLFTVHEPERKGRLQEADSGGAPWPVVWRYIIRHWRIYFAFLIGVPFIVVLLYGLQAWVPTFLVRVYEWDIPRAGRSYGLIALLAGSAGVLTGPIVARWLDGRGYKDSPLRVTILATVLACSAVAPVPLQSDPMIALFLIGAASFFVTLPLALVASALQTVTPNEMRGLIAGLYVVTVNVIGLGAGPTIVALLTDRLFGDPAAVGKSLALLSVGVAPIAIAFLAIGMKPYRARMEARSGQDSV